MSENKKQEHAVLADFSFMFTKDMLRLAASSLTNRAIPHPKFMTRVPGKFHVSKKGQLKYTDSEGISRSFVPKEQRQKLLNALWGTRVVPRGQESFTNYVNRRYIGIQARYIRQFVAEQVGIQHVSVLRNLDERKRAIRSSKPWSHLSCDLADMISFSDIRGKENSRFIFLLVDHFSGYLFHALLPLGKNGGGVAKAYRRILKKIKQKKGVPRILTSDLGTEFHNKHFQAVNQEFNINHLKPKQISIAPFIENRVRTWKRYLRLNSHLLYSHSKWWEPQIMADTTKAVNNIQSKTGYSPREIISRFQKDQKSEVINSVNAYHRKDETKDDTDNIGYNLLQSGDFVRLRVAKRKEKLGSFHKSHLGFKADYLEEPVNWSTEIYTVIKKHHIRRLRKYRYQISNKEWYNRSQLLRIPASTGEYVRMIPPDYKPEQKVPKPRIVKKKTTRRKKIDNTPTQQIVSGRRSSRLRSVRRIDYAE